MGSDLIRRITVLAAVLSIGVGVGVYLSRPAQNLSGDESRQMSARMDALESSLAAEQLATRQLLERLDRRVGSSPASAATPVGNRHETMRTPAEQAQAMQRDATRMRLELAKTFATLTPAPPRDKVPQRVNEAFVTKGVLGAPELPLSESVNCKSTMCLISAHFGPSQDGSDWTNRILLELSDTLPNASVTSERMPDGGLDLQIYAARVDEHDPFGRAAAASR